ncbi:MAG TPA: hypothetical protein V6C85_28100, partial [Allocoleopsis sp.]
SGILSQSSLTGKAITSDCQFDLFNAPLTNPERSRHCLSDETTGMIRSKSQSSIPLKSEQLRYSQAVTQSGVDSNEFVERRHCSE